MSREEEIAARLEAATPGAWKVEGKAVWTVQPDGGVGRFVCGEVDATDGPFIASAPSDTAYLLAKLTAGEAENARLREALATTGEARECANFSPAGPLNCYVEPPEGWAVKLDPCPFCALALTDKEAPNECRCGLPMINANWCSGGHFTDKGAPNG